MLLLLEKKSKQTIIIIIIIIIIKMKRIIGIEERRWGINRHRIGDYLLLLLLFYKHIVSIFLNDVFLQFLLIVSQLFCIINRINRMISFLYSNCLDRIIIIGLALLFTWYRPPLESWYSLGLGKYSYNHFRGSLSYFSEDSEPEIFYLSYKISMSFFSS